MKEHINSFVLGASIVLGSYLLYCGIDNYAHKDRYVSVKGLAEREVMADRVVWPLSFNEVGNNMNQLYEMIETKQRTIVNFLKENGIKDDEITISAPSVLDRLAQQWTQEHVRERYQTSCTITVISSDVPKIMSIMKMQQELMKKGVAIEGNSYDIRYQYTNLNSLKPEMIEEATRNARQVAEKFAQDADCDLGSIKFASQGQFSINEEYTTPHIKNVRVVTTIDYYLK
ncbi:MAG: SIMPL domain-containing protein [Salinivirgaceae bacterium]|nr:SIMPL domain-containing protein [Salinivirgaceae bacterium]